MSLDIKIKREADLQHQSTLTVELGGSLDTATAPQLEKQLNAALDETVRNLIFDLEKLTFISSAGLRVFAASRKFMKQRNEPVLFVHLQPHNPGSIRDREGASGHLHLRKHCGIRRLSRRPPAHDSRGQVGARG